MSKSFQSVQAEFVHAIKDPSSYKTDNAENTRRMHIYQSLFFNNIDNFVSTGFPVLKSVVIALHNAEGWEQLVRDFFITHTCRSPYFAEISKEFVEYLSIPAHLTPTHSTSTHFPISLPAFCAELAHYEWLELDVSTRINVSNICFYHGDEPVSDVKVSPYASLASYTYAVHLIGDDYMPDKPAAEQQYYVVYRDEQYNVEFVHLTPLTAILVHIVEQQRDGIALGQLATLLSEQLPQIPKDTITNGMQHTVIDMLNKGILLLADNA